MEGTMEIVIRADCLVGMKHTRAGTVITVSEDVGRHLVMMQRAHDLDSPRGKAWKDAFDAAKGEDEEAAIVSGARSAADAAAKEAAQAAGEGGVTTTRRGGRGKKRK